MRGDATSHTLSDFWLDLIDRAARLLERSWVSYAFITLLQVKVIWNIWRFRDLTTGDTSSYFVTARAWAEHLAVNLVWSPLYTAFYGSVFAATHDIYAATILHRVVIVIAASLGVLALMRRILPPALALLIASWWAVLPVNFDTLYEIHLFALLPIIAAWLVAARADTPLARGTIFAILSASTVLVRNEMAVACGIFAIICVVREIRELPGEDGGLWKSLSVRAVGYGIPLLVVAGVFGFIYWRTEHKGHLAEMVRQKHALNMCQVYAFNYSQRDPTWTASPWTECGPLMKETFGKAAPSLREMFGNNPEAAFKNVLWSISLVPNGIQAALFGAMSGTVNPDYAPVARSWFPAVAGACAILLIARALFVAWPCRRHWWDSWFRARKAIWFAMFPVLCAAISVVMTQRPRPSYFFADTVILMAVIGSAAFIVASRRPSALRIIPTVICVGIFGFVPAFYAAHPSERPLYGKLEALQPFSSILSDRRKVLLLGDYSGELVNYLDLKREGSQTFDNSVLSLQGEGEALDQFLQRKGINLVVFDPRIVRQLRNESGARTMIYRPESVGWRSLGLKGDGNPDWLLLSYDAAKK